MTANFVPMIIELQIYIFKSDILNRSQMMLQNTGNISLIRMFWTLGISRKKGLSQRAAEILEFAIIAVAAMGDVGGQFFSADPTPGLAYESSRLVL
jgi:hypothetical protein